MAQYLTISSHKALKRSSKYLAKFGYQLAISEDDDDENLIQSDYVVTKMLILDKKFTLIHGFPGDSPNYVLIYQGARVDIKNPSADLADYAGHFRTWYAHITENGTNFDHEAFIIKS